MISGKKIRDFFGIAFKQCRLKTLFRGGFFFVNFFVNNFANFLCRFYILREDVFLGFSGSLYRGMNVCLFFCGFK